MNEGIILRDKCPICDSTSSKTIFNRSFNEEIIKKYMEVGYQGNADIEFLKDVHYEIAKCNNCKLSYQKYVLNNVKLNELYNKWIDPQLAIKWNESNKFSYKNYFHIFNFAKKQLKKQTSEIKVLDYGAGFGDLLILASEMGFDTYAYEYSTERIRFLESKGIKTITNNCDMLFDFIIANQVFEHLTYPKLVLEEINWLFIKSSG